MRTALCGRIEMTFDGGMISRIDWEGRYCTWVGGTGTFDGFDTEMLLLYNRRSSSILGSRQMGRLPPFYSPTLVECGNLEDSVWGWARFRLATICTDISACSLLLPAALPEVSNWLL